MKPDRGTALLRSGFSFKCRSSPSMAVPGGERMGASLSHADSIIDILAAGDRIGEGGVVARIWRCEQDAFTRLSIHPCVYRAFVGVPGATLANDIATDRAWPARHENVTHAHTPSTRQ